MDLTMNANLTSPFGWAGPVSLLLIVISLFLFVILLVWRPRWYMEILRYFLPSLDELYGYSDFSTIKFQHVHDITVARERLGLILSYIAINFDTTCTLTIISGTATDADFAFLRRILLMRVKVALFADIEVKIRKWSSQVGHLDDAVIKRTDVIAQAASTFFDSVRDNLMKELNAIEHFYSSTVITAENDLALSEAAFAREFVRTMYRRIQNLIGERDYQLTRYIANTNGSSHAFDLVILQYIFDVRYLLKST